MDSGIGFHNPSTNKRLNKFNNTKYKYRRINIEEAAGFSHTGSIKSVEIVLRKMMLSGTSPSYIVLI